MPFQATLLASELDSRPLEPHVPQGRVPMVVEKLLGEEPR
jgi:hypothetical protein